MEENLTKKILKFKKKTITREELSKLYEITEDKELFAIVSTLEKENILKKFKKKTGSNGNYTYPVYDKYHIVIPAEHNKQLIEEIKILHPSIICNDYLLKNPHVYQANKEIIQKLNSYLFENTKPFKDFISKKERSFEIFNEEKELDKKTVITLLSNIGFTSKEMRYYETPDNCYNDYIIEKKKKLTLLICENKDLWFGIRKIMYDTGKHVLYGVSLDGVIYGEGNKITAKDGLLSYTKMLNVEPSDIKYLYCGDIDRAGFKIYQNLKETTPELNIELFTPIYYAMLNLAKGVSIPDSTDNRQIRFDFKNIYQLFNDEAQNELKYYINNNKRLPQEIITNAIIEKKLK